MQLVYLLFFIYLFHCVSVKDYKKIGMKYKKSFRSINVPKNLNRNYDFCFKMLKNNQVLVFFAHLTSKQNKFFGIH